MNSIPIVNNMPKNKQPNSTLLPSTMKAFVIDDTTQSNPIDNGKLQTNVPIPTIPSSSYALIRILRAGICNTDLEILQGYMGFKGILGHEFVGTVVALHDDTPEDIKQKWLNKRVCGDINLGCCNNNPPPKCGICHDALQYDTTNSQMSRNHCPNRTVLGILNQNGTFCEYMILPIMNLHEVPPNITNEVAVFAEPLAAACRVVEQGLINFQYNSNHRRGGDRVAILGDGKLGLCVAEILGREYLRHYSSCGGSNNNNDESPPPPPTLFGKHENKMDLVKDSGVRTQLVSTCYIIDDNNQEQISPDHHHKYDVVIDATGNPNGLTLAMALCRPMGKLCLKSTCASGVKGFHSAPIVIDELLVVGSRCGPIDVALNLLSSDEKKDNNIPPLRMEKYITKTFPLSKVREALEFSALKSTMKVQLVMTEGNE